MFLLSLLIFVSLSAFSFLYWYYLNIFHHRNMYGRPILVCFFFVRVCTSFFSLLFIDVFGRWQSACVTLSAKNEYEEEQNQSFFLFSCFFFCYTRNHMPCIPLLIFSSFFFLFFTSMSTCRTFMLIRLLRM